MKLGRLLYGAVVCWALCWSSLAWGSNAAELKNADGTWKYTNALIDETSPYLLSHAHNPVDWHPWGPEAFELARKLDRPIFLSVGYSTCYWCHVMERLVFCNVEIAEAMNASFVNIKVDREERPDIDKYYMTATQLLSGRGGWPNSVFLSPDLKPLYAGTYFPPTDGHGSPSFPRVIAAVNKAWENDREQLVARAEQVAEGISQIQSGGDALKPGPFSREHTGQLIGLLKADFDNRFGGFGGAPKFPNEIELATLLAEHERSDDQEALDIVVKTLSEMARGGIHDHLAGGFHRYSTDAQWRVPHFEKMLYNQAQLASVYLRAYRLTEREELLKAAKGILAFVDKTMTGPNGEFYSAVDSETEEEEGKSYLWTEDEIRAALGKDAAAFLRSYGLAPMPHGEGKTLYVKRPMERDDLLRRLLQARNQRPQPLIDTKALTGWNGMMIGAYAEAYMVLNKKEYLRSAERAAAFIEERLRDEHGNLLRSYRAGKAKGNAFLDDYAFYASGLLKLHEATGNEEYLRRAQETADEMKRRFWDEEKGAFYFTESKGDLPLRVKSLYDGAIPSGNSEAAHALLSLSSALDDLSYRELAYETLRSTAEATRLYPRAFVWMLAAAARYLDEPLPAAVLLNNSEALAHLTIVSAPPEASAGSVFEVEARLKVESGWHVNANPASESYLIPTTIESADARFTLLSVEYPSGETKSFAFSESPIQVYDGEASFRLSVQAPSDAAGETQLTIRARYQACNDELCREPMLGEAFVSIRIVE
ncbi:MAG: DUF255 domain-containing protein [Candidatus Poribacteria bacterium]|nr:DUF255 domain-containing protein [Candidatus Poribacteria bacterium]